VEFPPDSGHAVPGESGETMTRRPRRNHTLAFKAKVALAAIKSEMTSAQLSEHFDVHLNQITAWKALLQEGAADVFGGGDGPAPPSIDVKSLHAKIGELTLRSRPTSRKKVGKRLAVSSRLALRRGISRLE
jgi:transposase-like protein